jgi:hypothetical protein
MRIPSVKTDQLPGAVIARQDREGAQCVYLAGVMDTPSKLGTVVALAMGCLSGCTDPPLIEPELAPGVVFTYPRDHQRDVPLGARMMVSFSDPVIAESTNSATLVGPAGAVDATVTTVGGGKTLAITSSALQPGTPYAIVLAGAAEPLLSFTTRNDRPLAGPPTLIAVNGSAPEELGAFRPMLDTSTIQLVFSEPLDPRTLLSEPGSIELVDDAGQPVPFTLLAHGIHASLDPRSHLTPGARYELRIGSRIADLGGDVLAPASIDLVPANSIGRGAIAQTFRTRVDGDPNPTIARTDTPNAMDVVHPMIGSVSSTMAPTVIATELGDPAALGGPIAFTIPRGQRFSSTGLDILLAGIVPSGLVTGSIQIELLADAGGRLYRNTNQPADTLPDNERSPLLVDLSLDLAVYATDPTGNAVLAQTILGVQLTGLAVADHGALAIESLGALEINLLGVATAPTNLVLDLISAPGASPESDTRPPALISSLPAADSADAVADEGIELVFDEPIDIDRARDYGITLRDATGGIVPASLESHGSVVVIRPRATLPAARTFHVELTDVADSAGNEMAPRMFALGTQVVAQTDVPPSVVAVHPGAPCSLVDASPTMAGRCAGGAVGDDRYRAFTLGGDERAGVVFDQALRLDSIALGKTCDTGSVRVERVDASGRCTAVVIGTLVRHLRDLAFVPDQRWQPGEHYRLRLVSGANATCDAGELCGANGKPANFDRLVGTSATAGGGPDLVIDFLGAEASGRATLFASANPSTDVNGSGRVETGEQPRDTNRVALKIAGTSGLLSTASFTEADCIPGTPEIEGCMYVLGAIPAQLGARRDNCVLPDGTTVASCVPVAMSPQAMYSTSVGMSAGALGISIPTSTGMSVMRMRDPASGPLEGFIIERDGKPVMVTALDLYMDAPDMSLPLSQHDMHSKRLAVSLEGPVVFRADGRLALELSNTADVPISVGINAPFGISGAVNLVVPKGEMRLQLLTRSQRGSLP